jgi:cellulose synthase/poly-beta-1,6-N-acetylglucosamine synthase-like glycosyltransferase
MIRDVNEFVQWLLLIPLALSTLYLFIFALAGLFYREKISSEPVTLKRILVLIPGFQEDSVIIEAVKNVLRQDYPIEFFRVVVIADSFQEETLRKLRELPIIVLEPMLENRTKAKALRFAMQHIDEPFDFVLVFDADNHLAPGFLQLMNKALSSGCRVVQAHRTAKNRETPLAVLEGISEEINNHIFRKGHRVLGLSASLTGSGMGFQSEFFKEMIQTITAIGGLDKEIELKLLKDKVLIEYLDTALVYDEKTSAASEFRNQRRRWIAAQYFYFFRDILPALKTLLSHGNFGYFQKTLQLLMPPRILLLGFIGIFTGISLAVSLIFEVGFQLPLYWFLLLCWCILTLLLAVPASYYRLSVLKSLLYLPYGIYLMFLSLLHIRGANKHFLHTRHHAVNPVIDE